jgi:hypothetical protein
MTIELLSDTVLRGYLLGSLAPEQRAIVDARIFSDDGPLWERLCLIEDELIDDYVNAALEREDQAKFDEHFLCTLERREKLAFARSLTAYARRQPERLTLWQWLQGAVATPRWAVAAVAVALAIGLVPTVSRFAAVDRPAAVSASLTPGLVRGGGELPRVVIAPGAQLVRLHLTTGAEQYTRYRATVHEVSGDEIWSQARLVSVTGGNGATVAIALPRELLPLGDYYVQLFGLPAHGEHVPLGRYDFRVLPEH